MILPTHRNWERVTLINTWTVLDVCRRGDINNVHLTMRSERNQHTYNAPGGSQRRFRNMNVLRIRRPLWAHANNKIDDQAYIQLQLFSISYNSVRGLRRIFRCNELRSSDLLFFYLAISKESRHLVQNSITHNNCAKLRTLGCKLRVKYSQCALSTCGWSRMWINIHWKDQQ